MRDPGEKPLRGIEALLCHVADHANHLPGLRGDGDALSDGIAVGEGRPRGGLVEDDDTGRIEPIVSVGDGAAGTQLSAQRLEVTRRHEVEPAEDKAAAGLIRGSIGAAEGTHRCRHP